MYRVTARDGPRARGGHEQLCETPAWVGLSQHDGGYAEYLAVPHERYLVKLRNLTPAVAAPLDQINDVYKRVTAGKVAGRVVIVP